MLRVGGVQSNRHHDVPNAAQKWTAAQHISTTFVGAWPGASGWASHCRRDCLLCLSIKPIRLAPDRVGVRALTLLDCSGKRCQSLHLRRFQRAPASASAEN